MNRYEIIESALSFRGKRELLKHLDGEKLTQRQAIYAKCYECCGYFADGRQDCQMPDCPLYPFMQYNPNRLKTKKQSRVVSKMPSFAVKRVAGDVLAR